MYSAPVQYNSLARYNIQFYTIQKQRIYAVYGLSTIRIINIVRIHAKKKRGSVAIDRYLKTILFLCFWFLSRGQARPLSLPCQASHGGAGGFGRDRNGPGRGSITYCLSGGLPPSASQNPKRPNLIPGGATQRSHMIITIVCAIISFIDIVFGCLCLGGVRAIRLKDNETAPVRILLVCAAVFFINAICVWM